MKSGPQVERPKGASGTDPAGSDRSRRLGGQEKEQEPEGPPERRPLRSRSRIRTFEALRDADFRSFFAAQVATFAALNVQIFMRGWLVYELTGSYEKLGLATAANGVVGLLLAPLGGALADRVRQKKYVVQIAQAVNAVTALWVAWTIAQGELRFGHLLVAAFVQGSSMSLMMPSRQALTPEVVGMGRLMNAIALNTSGMNAARLLMPGLAGWAVGALGAGDGNIAPAQYVYLCMAALYAGSVFLLLPVRVEDRPPLAVQGAGLAGLVRSVLSEIRAGLVYTVRTPTVRMLLVWNFLMVFFGMTYFMLLPGFVKDVLQTGPEGLGILQSVSGTGSLAGSLVIASLPQRNRGLLLLGSALLIAVGVLGLAFSTVPLTAAVALLVLGIGQAGRMSLCNVLIQTYVDDSFRGRVMSLYLLEFSLMQVSVYGAGWVAESLGVEWAIALSGLGMLGVGVGLLVGSPTYRGLQ